MFSRRRASCRGAPLSSRPASVVASSLLPTRAIRQLQGTGGIRYAAPRSVLRLRPRRGGPYLELARWRRLQIAYAAETHLHSDFLTGSRELAAADGAQVLAPHASRLGFPHRGLVDGEEVDLGGLTLRA
ncbi:MAG TPA: hypothetical protein VGR74_01570, partial [Actinomycetota bacterium]|nr:hypothetical protein [Actinomycetota bacterium]